MFLVGRYTLLNSIQFQSPILGAKRSELTLRLRTVCSCKCFFSLYETIHVADIACVVYVYMHTSHNAELCVLFRRRAGYRMFFDSDETGRQSRVALRRPLSCLIHSVKQRSPRFAVAAKNSRLAYRFFLIFVRRLYVVTAHAYKSLIDCKPVHNSNETKTLTIRRKFCCLTQCARVLCMIR